SDIRRVHRASPPGRSADGTRALGRVYTERRGPRTTGDISRDRAGQRSQRPVEADRPRRNEPDPRHRGRSRKIPRGLLTMTTLELGGKPAFVTGSTRGIGRAVAGALYAAGAKVAIVGRDAERSKAVAAEFGERALGVAADVAVGAQIEAAIAA